MLDTCKAWAPVGEVIFALWVIDAHSFKRWLSVWIKEPGKPAEAELMCDTMNFILTSEEAVRMAGWQLGVSLGKPPRCSVSELKGTD